MSKYQQFIFKDYNFDTSSKRLSLNYGLDEAINFTETYQFDFDFVDYDSAQLDRAIQNLFFVAGVSYYKTYVPPTISVAKGQIDQQHSEFLSTMYQQGLGEFFYVNHLDPRTPVTFPVTAEALDAQTTHVEDGLLVGIGGGKDSLLSVELLRSQPRVATWSLNHREQLEPLIREIGLPHFWVSREWDAQIAQLNAQDALNGHIPISAIFACVGTIVGILSGYSQAVVSNENSANEPTLVYDGVPVNHQYSKSIAFEKMYQQLLTHCFGDSLQYFSFVRPLSELRVAELFAKYGFNKYKAVFSSCNRAFTHDSHNLFWCGECPKCAFVFLALTPFVPRSELEALWKGKNLLLDPALEETYRNLLGIAGEKPLECVGEIKETRAAMQAAQKIYPELAKYSFELPDDYDYTQLAPHAMSGNLYKVLTDSISGL